MSDPMLIAQSKDPLYLLPAMSNRHGLIAGATGTGKTVTLQVMAEAFSRIGVPVFAADVKGDLSGISQPGVENPKIADRVKKLELTDFSFAGCPVTFWDVFGEEGHPVRATVSEMGPLLFSRLLNLNETQAGVLTAVFKIADDQGLQHRLQVLQIEQQQLFIVRNLEDQRQDALLRVVEAKQPAEEQRPHLRDRRANRMPLFAKYVPKGDRAAAEGEVCQLHLFHSRGDFRIVHAWLADTAEVSLNIGGKNRNPDPAEAFGHYLQRHRLPRAGGAGDETVAVGHIRQQV